MMLRLLMVPAAILLIGLLSIGNAFCADVKTDVSPFLQMHANAELEEVVLQDVPFSVSKPNNGRINIMPSTIAVGNTLSKIFLLGMTTDWPLGNEGWTQSPRYYDMRSRFYIGDNLGRIMINYADQTMDIIPVVAGVNCWPYEMFESYPEPFKSDANANRLLDESLVMASNDGQEKGLRYIFCIRPRQKKIEQIVLQREAWRDASYCVTAITGLLAGSADVSADKIKAYDEGFFVRKEYFAAMDKLARRLYQFRDDIPKHIALDIPSGYTGPRVNFAGNAFADIFTNVYYYNLHDMATKKVDADGMMHTSSLKAPSFGSYTGFGTFANDSGSYYCNIWSRDLGRTLMEMIGSGESIRSVKAAEKALHYLYDRNLRYDQPNWKRIANIAEIADDPTLKLYCGKENDGHGNMMLFIYRLYQHGFVDKAWVSKNWKAITDAAEWYCWQMENPDKSSFDKVLYSESESSTQTRGGYDLFANATSYYGLKAFARMAVEVGKKDQGKRWDQQADRLWDGIIDVFTTKHPRCGPIFIDTIYDGWTWEYKRFAPLFLAADLTSYDVAKDDPALFDLCRNTYLAQKEDYFSYDSARQMGYGQGYITEAALMMDNSKDIQGYVEHAAGYCYHNADHNYIVPEGVITHPSDRFWYRNGDLGNGVQQAEIVKCARLIIGLDDLNPGKGLSTVSRLPAGWKSINVGNYPVRAENAGSVQNIELNYAYTRTGKGFSVKLTAAKPIDHLSLRFGPFSKSAKSFKISGTSAKHTEFATKDSKFVYLELTNAKNVNAAVIAK